MHLAVFPRPWVGSMRAHLMRRQPRLAPAAAMCIRGESRRAQGMPMYVLREGFTNPSSYYTPHSKRCVRRIHPVAKARFLPHATPDNGASLTEVPGGNFQEWLKTPAAGMAIYAFRCDLKPRKTSKLFLHWLASGCGHPRLSVGTSAVWVTLMGIGVKYARAGGIPVDIIIIARTMLGIFLALSVCAAQGINPLGTQRKANVVKSLCNNLPSTVGVSRVPQTSP
eukprot:2581968-Pyramimonas_sp.AAC.1